MPKVTVLKEFRSKYDGAILKKKDEGKMCNLSDRDLDEISKRSGGPYVKVEKSYKRDAKTDKIVMDDANEVKPYSEEIKDVDPR